MKIIVLGGRGFPNVQGGVETHCENLYPALVKLGVNVTVITRRVYIDPAINSYQGVHLVPLDCPRNKFLEAIIHTFKGVLLAKKMGCDVLHIHAIGPSLFVPMARILGLKVVMTNHGPDYERKKWNFLAKSILRLGEWNGCVFANKIIAISKTIIDHIKKCYGRQATQIPNGVVIPPKIEDEEILKKFGLTKGKYVLTVGRFVPEKGFGDLIDAFNMSKSSIINNYKLVIVGDADHVDKYSVNLKNKAALMKNIVLTGRQTGLPLKELYSHAGLFVLPSYYEGLPIVLLEALSYGLSCIASAIPSNQEIDLDQSRFFPPGDLKTMAEKIDNYLASPLTTEAKNAQIKMISEKYNWEKIAQDTLKVYQKVFEKK